MSEPFIAEIRMFPFNFAPRGWATCNGQVLPISQNTALYALIGTYYGGDGRSNFALPNLQGLVPVSQGQGQGLSSYQVGQTGGAPSVTLLAPQNAAHTHPVTADGEFATSPSPSSAIYMKGHYTGSPAGSVAAYTVQPPDTNMNPSAIQSAGGNQAHNNMMPYLVLNFCICLQGIYPQRS